jgi:hypothetical protein
MKFFLVGVSLVFASSFNCAQKSGNNLRAVEVCQNFPYIGHDGILSHYDTSFTRIYFFKDEVLVSPSNISRYFKNEELINVDLKWHYFWFKKGEIHGYLTDEEKKIFKQKHNIDSFLNKQYAFFDNTSRIKELKPKLLAENLGKGKISKRIKYTVLSKFKDLHGNLNIDTLELNFDSKMTQNDFSFSKYFDSLHNSKLVSIIYKTPPKYFETDSILVSALTVENFYSEFKIENEKKIMEIFESFK